MCGIFGYFSRKVLTIKQLDKVIRSFNELKNRGPNETKIEYDDYYLLGFHRLAINNLTKDGSQPINTSGVLYTVCNGEIYNYKKLIEQNKLERFVNGSDCNILPYLYIFNKLDEINMEAEFAYIIVDVLDKNVTKVIVGRDPMGVRPLFWGYDENNIGFASEAKALIRLFKKIEVFPPAFKFTIEINKNIDKIEINKYPMFNNGEIFKLGYIKRIKDDIKTIYLTINNLLTEAVNKRLMSDTPIGCLLSGGLDSSLISALTAKKIKNLQTFTIGFEEGTDIPYSVKVAKLINSNHTVINISVEEALSVIEETICIIESYDITTVRASIMQYLIGKYISKTTNIKVLMVGEGSDELFQGYKMMHNAPSIKDAYDETLNLLQEIHLYDGLRVDRATSVHGLEVRLPFLDINLVKYVLSINPEFLRPVNGSEKYLLRKSFENDDLLPKEVLWRPKEAFSDGCSSEKKSWYQIIQKYIDIKVSDEEFNKNKDNYIFNKPYSKEAYYYRKIFDLIFNNNSQLIPHIWLHKWSKTKDPSARTFLCNIELKN